MQQRIQAVKAARKPKAIALARPRSDYRLIMAAALGIACIGSLILRVLV